jgi:hypothetical protein
MKNTNKGNKTNKAKKDLTVPRCFSCDDTQSHCKLDFNIVRRSPPAYMCTDCYSNPNNERPWAGEILIYKPV